MKSSERTGVLFVCLGNICRSPLAEGIFLNKVNQQGVSANFRVDSAGTGGWHTGEPADSRALKVAKIRGVVLPSRARQVKQEDFTDFDHIICMDRSNYEDLLSLNSTTDRVKKLLDFHPDKHLQDVPDPYYDGADGFDKVFDMVDVACDGLLEFLLAGKS